MLHVTKDAMNLTEIQTLYFTEDLSLNMSISFLPRRHIYFTYDYDKCHGAQLEYLVSSTPLHLGFSSQGRRNQQSLMKKYAYFHFGNAIGYLKGDNYNNVEAG